MNRPDPLVEAYVLIETPLGPMALGAHNGKLRGAILPRLGEKMPLDAFVARIWPNAASRRRILPEIVPQVRAYWQCRPTDTFRAKLSLEGFPPFFCRVWQQTMKIPPGEVRTYSQLAAAVGSPKACRAVGGAMAANPIPLIVPCHRVVAASTIGGFSAPGGLRLKEFLLEWERSGRTARESQE